MAFYNCDTLISVVIPNSIKSIGNRAFASCDSLINMIIPDSVTSMGWYVFLDCYSLTIYCEAESKPSDWHSEWNVLKCPVFWDYKV